MGLTNVTIATGGASNQVLPARIGRSRLIISPYTEDCWVQFGSSAAVNVGEKVTNGSATVFSADKFPEIGGSVNIYSATTGANIGIREM